MVGEKVCIHHKNKGDEYNNGGHKDYRWVSQDNKHRGDKVAKDKFCKANSGDHENNNGDHNANKHDNDDGDDKGHVNKNNDDDRS